MNSMFWLALSIVLYMLEASTAALVCIWFAIGATAALVCSLFKMSMFSCFAVFVLTSAVMLIFTRKFVKKFKPESVATNADALIGKPAVVTKEINPVLDTGAVMVKGNEWSAVSRVGEVIKKGELVEVVAITGVKLVVVHCENPLSSIAAKKSEKD